MTYSNTQQAHSYCSEHLRGLFGARSTVDDIFSSHLTQANNFQPFDVRTQTINEIEEVIERSVWPTTIVRTMQVKYKTHGADACT